MSDAIPVGKLAAVPRAARVPADWGVVVPRLVVAGAVGVAAGAIAWVKAGQGDGFATDFQYFLAGARTLASGANPYTGAVPFVYPLPAAVVLAPLAGLSVTVAGVLFTALSFALCAFALTRDGWQRLPILMSFPSLWAMSSGQWAPLVMCAALGSGYGWTAALKPTLGAAMLARRLDWRGAVVATLFALLTLAINPRWPVEWLRAMQVVSGEGWHFVPVLVMGGPLLLLAALRWRTEDGRLLLALALIPQSPFFYDQFALGLLARTRLHAICWSLWSYAVAVAAFLLAPHGLTTKAENAAYFARVIVIGYYGPALAWVLRRRRSMNDL